MPIRPDFRKYYQGPEWEATRARILKRARNECEECHKPKDKMIRTKTGDGRMFWRLLEGSLLWRNESGWPLTKEELQIAMEMPARTIRVQIGVAHVDGDPTNRDDSNLRAWCNWCHIMHDRPQHKLTRSIHKDQRRPLLMEAVAS